MNACNTRLHGCLLCIVALFAIGYSLPLHSARTGTRQALLIGINDYQELPKLYGAVNDVETMRELLVSRYGFDPDNVTVLTDSQATRKGILSALNTLVSSAGPNDVVYIHYSGHGSQVEDLGGDEADGADETICPRDARTPGIPDITDDEIDGIISRFKTQSVFVVMDSCHSGTVLRAANNRIRQRFVPPDQRTYLYQNLPGEIRTREVVSLPATERYLLITGAAAHQSALDGPFDNGRYHGLLTYSLAQSLSQLPRDATPVEIMDRIEQQISAMQPQLEGNPVPEPQLEAPGERMDLPFLAMTGESQESAEIRLPGKTTLFLRNMTGAIRAQLERDLPDQEVGLSILETGHGGADFVVDCGQSPTGPGWDCQVAASQSGYETSRVDASPERMAEKIAGSIRSQLLLHALWSLRGYPSNLQIDLHIADAGTASTGYRGISVTHDDAPARVQFYRPGSPRTLRNSLQLEVHSSHNCYLTVAYLDSSGGLQVIFPDTDQGDDFYPEGLIHKGMTARIPDSLLNDNHAGFHWDFGPPAGEDTVLAFCMTERAQASVIRLGIQKLSGQSVTAGNGTLRELSTELDADALKAATRGVRVSPDDTDPVGAGASTDTRILARDWNMAKIRLHIIE